MEQEAKAITINQYGASLVAINSQYHDYAELFRSWFTDGIEQRVIESAIVFWFKDADSKSENKVVEYFREH